MVPVDYLGPGGPARVRLEGVDVALWLSEMGRRKGLLVFMESSDKINHGHDTKTS